MDMVSITAAVANAATMSAAFIQSQAMLALSFLGFAQATVAVQFAVLAALVIVPIALVVGLVVLARKLFPEDNEPAYVAPKGWFDDEVPLRAEDDPRKKKAPAQQAAQSKPKPSAEELTPEKMKENKAVGDARAVEFLKSKKGNTPL